mmetsp:Transcript_104290/g.301710  ORF Transcript_104290/g.301710 Transcript_104290/m.301710 type:complete len:690 (+) Transcript_104290:88-2157(+)
MSSAALVALALAAVTGGARATELVYLVADEFTSFPGDRGEPGHLGDAVRGRVDIYTEQSDGEPAKQVLQYRVTGVDDRCTEGGIGKLSGRSCSIYIAKGNPCAEMVAATPASAIPERLWNQTKVKSDPWVKVRYAHLTSKYGHPEPGDEDVHTARGAASATTGLEETAAAMGHTIVLHDADGEQLACSAITQVHGCYPDSEWEKQGLFDFSHAHERCGFNMWCTKGHPECREYCNDLDNLCPDHLVCDLATERCRHRALFDEQMTRDMTAGIAFAVISGLAMSVGVGGGGLFVPLLMVILRFDVHASTALSQACLAGGAITAMMHSAQAKHPSGQGPLIEWDLLLITSPSLLLGSLVGAFLNRITPDVAILGLLDVVLGYCTLTTLRKATSAWAKESKEMASAREVMAQSSSAAERGDAAGVSVELRSGPPQPSGKATRTISGEDKPRVQKPQYPLGDMGLFGATWILVVASTFVRGSKKSPGLVATGTPAYWVITMATAGCLLLLTSKGVTRVTHRAVHYAVPSSGDLSFDTETIKRLTIWSLGGGVIAALCGVGGGMIMGPILLDIGVLPQVQSATTGAMLLIMSTSTAISFLVAGTAPLDYAAFLACCTGCGAVFGKAVVTAIIKKFNRPSLVMFLLAFLIIVSMLLMTTTGVLKVLPDVMHYFSGDRGMQGVAGEGGSTPQTISS